jgi:sulfur-oxidizing protein SoxY
MKRRSFLLSTVLILAWKVEATPAEMQAAILKVTGGAPVRRGRVKLELPQLVENGNAVPLTVSVDSPMSATDHVRAIHLFTERNPQPNMLGVYLGPRAGRASVTTRVRIAGSQAITAIAQLSDGSFWSEALAVVVAIPACAEEG